MKKLLLLALGTHTLVLAACGAPEHHPKTSTTREAAYSSAEHGPGEHDRTGPAAGEHASRVATPLPEIRYYEIADTWPFCRKVVAAVSELAPEYEGRVEFVIVSAEETKRRQDEIVAFGFADQKHGLVAFSSEGEVVTTLPGHQFGKEEIVAVLQQVLLEGS